MSCMYFHISRISSHFSYIRPVLLLLTNHTLRKVGFSDSSMWRTGLSWDVSIRVLWPFSGQRWSEYETLVIIFHTSFIFALKKIRALWPKHWQDKPVFHTLESENPTFLMTMPVEKPTLNSITPSTNVTSVFVPEPIIVFTMFTYAFVTSPLCNYIRKYPPLTTFLYL